MRCRAIRAARPRTTSQSRTTLAARSRTTRRPPPLAAPSPQTWQSRATHREERTSHAARAVPPGPVRPPRWVRGRERRRPPRARSHDALGRRRPCSDGLPRVHEPDGPLRDRRDDLAQNLTALADLSGCWVDSDRWAAPTRRGTMLTSGLSAVAPSSRPTCVCRRLDDRHPGARVMAAHCVDRGRLESGHVGRESRCQTRPGGLDDYPQRASARPSGECRLTPASPCAAAAGLAWEGR